MWAGDVAVIMDMMDMSGADWSIHRPGETWGRVLRTLSPSWWLDLHTQPPSVTISCSSDCDDTAKAGAHSASRGAHRLHHPLGRCGVRGKYSSSFFWPLCCCISLLQRFSLNIMVCFLLIVLWGVLFLTFLSDQRVQVHCLITQQYLFKKMVQI